MATTYTVTGIVVDEATLAGVTAPEGRFDVLATRRRQGRTPDIVLDESGSEPRKDQEEGQWQDTR